jgi:heat shock protein HtpX
MAQRNSVSPRRPGAIASAFVIFTGLVGLGIGALAGVALGGLIAGIVVALLGILWAYASGISLLMRVLRAQPASEREQPRLYNLVDGLCLTAGVVPPALHVVSDDAPNAVVVAISPNKSAIAVTTGMLMECDRVELEAVVAHLIARLRSGDAIAGSLTALLIGAPLLFGQLGLRLRWWNGARQGFEQDRATQRSLLSTLGSVCGALILSIFTPILSPLVRLFVPSDLIAQADRAACQLTRYPPALVSVLARCDPRSDRLGSLVSHSAQTHSAQTHSALGITNHLWFLGAITGLDGRGPLARFHRNLLAHPPTPDRISFLKEL